MHILNIDTATEHASVCISNQEEVIGLLESTEQKNHASFVQPAIATILAQAGLALSNMDAIAVTIGPGSYTGLRVGLASAKGICYALDKPLIAINTLQVMAQAALKDPGCKTIVSDRSTLVCPLIDARRMEVFTATYDTALEELSAPHALIINANSFEALYAKNAVLFCGSGRNKLKQELQGKNIFYSEIQHNAADMAVLARNAYANANFADLAYSAPLYVKEFYDPREAK